MQHAMGRCRKSGWNSNLSAYILILMLCFSGCSETGSPTPQNQGHDTGAVAFKLQWPDLYKEFDADSAAKAMSDSCDNYGVATIEFIVYDQNNAALASKTFSCEAGTGRLDGIPIGTDRTLTIWADDVNGLALYGADVSPIEIVANQVNDVGAIGLEAFPYQAGALRIENASVDTIYTVNISHCTIDTWGWNQISTTVSPSTSTDVSEIPSGCYDVRVCTVLNPTDDTYCSVFMGVEVTEATTLSLSFTGY